jgi:hypothetical protein
MSSINAIAITNTAEMMDVINQIDLSRVSRRVAKEHPEWTQARLDAAIAEYRKFLCLVKAGHNNISPCLDVDEIWHAHILFTMDYVRDCNKVFGFYVHHNPLDDEEEEQQETEDSESVELQSEGFHNTFVAYQQVFGVLPPAAIWGTNGQEDASSACVAKSQESCEKDDHEASTKKTPTVDCVDAPCIAAVDNRGAQAKTQQAAKCSKCAICIFRTVSACEIITMQQHSHQLLLSANA